MTKKFLYFFITFCTLFLINYVEASYAYNPHVDRSVWEAVSPHFLPENHPAKGSLDKIFGKSRVTLNSDSVAAAGFKNPLHRSHSQTIVSKHPKIDGYIVKMYTDDQNLEDWSKWLMRIHGAKSVRKAIDHFDYGRLFKVPQKWIYPLPSEPSPPAGTFRKNFILIVEDLDVLPKLCNKKQWKGPFMTKKRLDALYTIIQEVGLDDSVIQANVPFCYDGKQAFIDLERHHHWPIDFAKLGHYLAPSMQKYWTDLINNGGPKK